MDLLRKSVVRQVKFARSSMHELFGMQSVRFFSKQVSRLAWQRLGFADGYTFNAGQIRPARLVRDNVHVVKFKGCIRSQLKRWARETTG